VVSLAARPAIFDAGPGALQRQLARLIDPPPTPPPSMPRIVDDHYQGDPFLTLIECGGQRYVLNEAALIEAEEQMFRDWTVRM
jgi:hypothetical protein